MNPILIISIFIIPFFKDIFSAIGSSREAKAVFVLIGGFLLYGYFKKEQEKADYSGASDAPPENLKFAEWAKRMHAALHPVLPYKVPEWIPILGGYFDDGTNENEVKQIAKEVGLVKGYAKLSEAYKVLFGDDLQQALIADDVLNDFNVAYQGTAGTATPKATPNTTTPTNGTRGLTVGAKIYSYGGWIVSNINNTPIRNSVLGEAWQIVDWKTETIRNTSGIWVQVKKKDINQVTVYKIFSKGLYFK